MFQQIILFDSHRKFRSDYVFWTFRTCLFLQWQYRLLQWRVYGWCIGAMERKELEYSKTLGLLKSIDLSSNKLVGKIPQELTSLEGLGSLNLSRNILMGNISATIGQMEKLEVLDLSRNQLSGEIPTGLASLTFLSVLNLSCNNFLGKIPISAQLQSFSASNYAGNHALCGLPLLIKCPGENESASVTDHWNDETNEEGEDTFVTTGFYASIVLGFAVGFWGFFGPLLLRRSWR